MAIKVDIKRGSQITNDERGFRAVRIAHVSGVAGNVEAAMYRAITEPRLPRIGDPHPVVPGVVLQSLVADPLGGGVYRVKLTYASATDSVAGSENAGQRVNASTATETTSTDYTGARMTARWTTSSSSTKTKPFKAEVERPRLTFEFDFVESNYPRNKISTYLGTVNSRPWNGYAAKTILCTAVDANRRGSDWRVRMSFAWNRETWMFNGEISTWSGAVTDDPLLDLTTGIKRFDVYKPVDFTPLGFVL